MTELLRARRRRAIRRRFGTRCSAVHWDRLDVVGERLIDLSTEGALLACDGRVSVGDAVLISFRLPWLGPSVVANATVTRVVYGWRKSDPGYCAGLRFDDLARDDRAELFRRLAPLPPLEASRPHPVDYLRTVRQIGHRPVRDAIIGT